MRRAGAAYMLDLSRHTRRSTERNGKFVTGPKSGRDGVGKGGRLKGRGRLRRR